MCYTSAFQSPDLDSLFSPAFPPHVLDSSFKISEVFYMQVNDIFLFLLYILHLFCPEVVEVHKHKAQVIVQVRYLPKEISHYKRRSTSNSLVKLKYKVQSLKFTYK